MWKRWTSCLLNPFSSFVGKFGVVTWQSVSTSVEDSKPTWWKDPGSLKLGMEKSILSIKNFANFYWVAVFFIINFWELSLYSGYKSFIRYMIWERFIPVCACLTILLTVTLKSRVLKIWSSSYYQCVFIDHILVLYLSSLCLIQDKTFPFYFLTEVL